MSLLEKAYKTYENQISRIGIESEDEEPLTPVSHMLANAHVEITLSREGEFIRSSAFPKQPKRTVIPVTLESASRSGTGAKDRPHPLSDQLMYLSPGLGGNYDEYIRQLSEWEQSEFSHPKLTAVLRYVKSKRILTDLAKNNIITLDGDEESEKNKKDEYKKYLIRWIVFDTGDYDEAWRDQELFKSYINWYDKILAKGPRGLCNIRWQEDVITDSHSKGVLAYANGAKLISSNDSSNFTYRGRFRLPNDAVTIGYTATQKAHNALRWLVATQGVRVGNRTFLWWKLSEPENEFNTNIGVLLGVGDNQQEAFQNFRNQLNDTLKGYQNRIVPDDSIIIAALEAATTGRLSVTYYNEMGMKDFAERVRYWYDTMAYNESGWTPSLAQIVRFAFGDERGVFVEVDDSVLSANMQRLLQCVVNKMPLPEDTVFSLVNKFSRPLSYSDKNLKTLRSTAFSAVKKYRNERYKEDWELGLDVNCKDRSYLFGRLLAIAEKIEDDTYTDGEKRTANAIRLQAAFSQHPMSTWRVLYEKLEPYKNRLRKVSNSRLTYYERLISEISDLIQWDNPSLNGSLSELYVLGYYHQRNAFYLKKQNQNEENEQTNFNENEGE